MRGRHRTWTRIRVNLKNVPAKLRPKQGKLDPDEKDLTGWEAFQKEWPRRKS